MAFRPLSPPGTYKPSSNSGNFVPLSPPGIYNPADSLPGSAATVHPGQFSDLGVTEFKPGILDIIKGVGSKIGESFQAGKQKAEHGSFLEKLIAGPETALRAGGAVAGGVGDIVTGAATDVYKTVVPDSVQKGISTNFQNAINKSDIPKITTAYKTWAEKHPEASKDLGAVVDIASLLPIGKGVELGGETIGKIAEKTIQPALKKTGEAVGKAATGIERFGLSQATGLQPSTIKQILETPEAFGAKKLDSVLRSDLATKVKGSVDQRLEELASTGKEYEAIRNSKESVTLPKDIVQKTLEKNRVKIVDGKIDTTDPEFISLGKGDIAEIEDFVQKFGSKEKLSGNGILNARKALDKMADFGADKTDASARIARALRKEYDATAKSQLTGLAELDARYAPEVELLSKIKRDYLNPDGSLKDGALNKIANLAGKGKDIELDRLEQVLPGVGDDIKILKSLEDVLDAGQKPGRYIKGGVAGSILGGPVGMIAGIVGTTPEVMIPILQTYAKVKGVGSSVVKGVESILKKFKLGKKLNESEMIILSNAVGHFKNKGQNLESVQQ